MGEKVILVCDVCGKPAVESVTFRIGDRNRVKDLCQMHLAELEAGSRAPRRGRKSAAVMAPASTGKRRGRPPGSKNTVSANGRRRGRPPKADSTPAKRSRKPITDPAVLEKRRAALEKARHALAQKRAEAKKAG